MYDYVTGRLAVRKPSYAVVEAGGVGYRIDIPLSTYEKLPKDGPVKLYTYLRITDDDHRLFGFITEREREVFVRLVEGVQQLGPSKAIAILSSVTADALTEAIEKEDVAALKNVRGIGEKLANRLVVELKGKLPTALARDGAAAAGARDAVAALAALGLDRRQAEEAVARAQKELGVGAAVEDLIKKGLARG